MKQQVQELHQKLEEDARKADYIVEQINLAIVENENEKRALPEA